MRSLYTVQLYSTVYRDYGCPDYRQVKLYGTDWQKSTYIQSENSSPWYSYACRRCNCTLCLCTSCAHRAWLISFFRDQKIGLVVPDFFIYYQMNYLILAPPVQSFYFGKRKREIFLLVCNPRLPQTTSCLQYACMRVCALYLNHTIINGIMIHGWLISVTLLFIIDDE